jgi:hypothetical protein
MTAATTMTEVSSSATRSAIDAFGQAFLDFVRNLTPLVILLAGYILAEVQAATITSGKWQWQMVSATCLVTAAIATFFNIVFFKREAAIAAPRSASWFIAKVIAVLMAVAVPIAFIGVAFFNSGSLLRSIFSNAAC